MYPKTTSDHVQHLKIVLQMLREKLYEKFFKCEFWLSLVALLGHALSKEGIKIDPPNIEAILDGLGLLQQQGFAILWVWSSTIAIYSGFFYHYSSLD